MSEQRRYVDRVDEVADRWLRRHTGPWVTRDRRAAGLVLTTRARWRPKVEFVRFAIARQHVWHALRPTAWRILRRAQR